MSLISPKAHEKWHYSRTVEYTITHIYFGRCCAIIMANCVSKTTPRASCKPQRIKRADCSLSFCLKMGLKSALSTEKSLSSTEPCLRRICYISVLPKYLRTNDGAYQIRTICIDNNMLQRKGRSTGSFCTECRTQRAFKPMGQTTNCADTPCIFHMSILDNNLSRSSRKAITTTDL